MAAAPHPALVNIEASPEPRRLELRGRLPAWLKGDLYRVGPGRFDFQTKQGGSYTIGHWFDGISMVHRFAVDGEKGSVEYRSRCIAEEKRKCIEEDGGSYSITFGTEPCYSVFGKTWSAMRLVAGQVSARDTAPNIGVDIKRIAKEGGGTRLVATSDQETVCEFDPETLEVVSYFDYSSIPGLESAKGNFSTTHGQRDERTKEYFNFVLFTQGPPKYRVFCVPNDKPAYVLAELSATPAYLHSFGLTEHYFILLVWPSAMQTMPPKILMTMNVVGSLTWSPELKVQIYVIDRGNGKTVGRYEAESFYCFHTVNSFEVEEEGGGRTVCVDLITYEDMGIIEGLKVDPLRRGQKLPASKYSRVTMRKVAADGVAVEEKQKAEVREVVEGLELAVNLEFGNVHPAWHMRKHRFVYVAGASQGCNTKLFDVIGKIDTEEGSCKSWREADCSPGEPVFFPRPNSTEEDDGVLMTMVSNAKTESSFLLLLDSKNLEELARAEMPNLFPLGFHGKFVAANEL